ncbi:MAG TPA: hypothetical protein VHV81_00880 [Steroidobacteraceae bacterium]|jgi:hypothetical protein|nr:hypothetical protein [Steroidobacteraceae bacterium]
MSRNGAGIQGKWNVTIEAPGGDRSGVLELATAGGSLTGFMTDGKHRVPIADGRVNGNELQWTARITKPMSMSLKFTATVAGDEIEGTAKHFLGAARFRGRRAE